MEHEEETGEDLLHEVFEDHRNHLQEEFDIDASTQRMDSTFIEANIKHLSRIDLIAKVVHNFVDDLPDEIVHELPAGIDEFASTENLEFSYELEPGEVDAAMETLIEHAAWLIYRFESEPKYAELESFDHLQQVLDEQCYRIAELEESELSADESDEESPGDGSPGWEPIRSFSTSGDNRQQEQANWDTANTGEDEAKQDRVGLKEPDEVGSGSIQNPHDVEATYRRKKGTSSCGYKANVAETCGGDNPFRLITTVRVDTNNTDDGDLLEKDLPELPIKTGLTDLLVDGGYTHREVEARCDDQGITQHFTRLTGQRPSREKLSLADAEWDGHRMVACPAGHEPFEQRYKEQSGRISGRMDNEFCEGCPHKEECFVQEQQQFYSYGFYERKLELAHRRKRLDDPAEEEFLNLRAGAESLVNEVYH